VRLGDVIHVDCGLGLFSAGRTWDMGVVSLCATFGNTAGMGRTGRWVNDTQDGLGRCRTNGGSVCVRPLLGFLCRVDEGKKRLAGWRRGRCCICWKKGFAG
jgi:hypothetical protein